MCAVTPLEDQIIAAVTARDPRRLAFMTLQAVRDIVPGAQEASNEDLHTAIKGLCAGDAPVLAEMYLLGEEVLDEETVSDWKESGTLVDPYSGEIIENADEVIGIAWYALDPAPQGLEP